MIVLGLAGPAGAGKDTVADYLVSTYGFVKFAFSDTLYAEVQHAFGLPDQSLLRDRDTKEKPSTRLTLNQCHDLDFVGLFARSGGAISVRENIQADTPLVPRQLLQLWGTEYRRAQNPNYWLNRAEDFITGLRRLYPYPECAPQHFVECGTRFENEREWIQTGALGGLWTGNVWHIFRDSLKTHDTHASAKPLEILEKERALYNNDSIERLYRGVDLLLTTQYKFVKVEPMLTDAVPKQDEASGD